jgi:voltage-gated potassium channel
MNSPEPSKGLKTARPHDPGLRVGKFRYSAVELLALLALLMLTAPFVEDWRNGDVVEAGLLTLVMMSAVLAVGGQRRTLVIATLLVLPALTAKWIHHLQPEWTSAAIFYMAAAMVFFAYVVANLLQFILRAEHVDGNVLCAGLSGYLMLGLLWVPAYVLVGRLNPAAFVMTAGTDAGAPMDGFHAFYFSFITLCTVGYGDVTPVSKVARMLAVIEAIAGLFYVAVLISRLVAVYSSPPKTAADEAELSEKNPEAK